MRNLIGFVSTVGAFAMAATPLLAAAGAAHAQDTQAIRIQTADLDFSRPTANAAFQRRVDAAADAFCRPAGVTELSRVAACKRMINGEAQIQLRQIRAGGDRAPTLTLAGR